MNVRRNPAPQVAEMYSLSKFLYYFFILSDLLFDVSANNAMIKEINNMSPGWMAGINKARIPKKFSVRKEIKHVIPIKPPRDESLKVPNFFDARHRWKECQDILSRVRDQGYCDSGWAVATASMLSDRACIHSKGQIRRHLSANELMTCCKECFPQDVGPCLGGSPQETINYFLNTGLVAGGEVNSQEGCQPYDKRFYDGDVVKNCSNSCIKSEDRADRTRGLSMYTVTDAEHLRKEILLSGPVLTEIDVFEDLLYYKRGIYVHQLGKKMGAHWVKLIGWGVRASENYWLVMNSLGRNFGHNGAMKFKRGVNSCGIEDDILTVKRAVGNYERQGGIHWSKGTNIRRPDATYFFVEMTFFYLLLCP